MKNCSECNKKLGLISYNPRKEWNITGKLCKSCFDIKNSDSRMVRLSKKYEPFQTFGKKGKWITISLVVVIIMSYLMTLT
jgi:hypothetical protein